MKTWPGDQRGPGRHNLYDVPRPQLNLADHPRLADLDGWLDGEDAPCTIPAPPMPRDRAARVRLGSAAPGVVNPPSTRIRRCGEGARFAGDLRSDARRHGLDQLHEDLGGYLDDDQELEAAPALTTDPGAVVKIGALAKRLERKVDAIRNWIEIGTIPPAPIRLRATCAPGPPPRPPRSWPQPATSASCRDRVGQYPKPTSPCELGKPAAPSRCGAIEKRKPSRIPG